MPTVIHLALCNRSHFHFYRRSPNISRAHVPGSAGNRVKRCIAFRSAGPGVGVDNKFVRTYVSHSMLCSDSHACLPLAGWAPIDLARTQTRHVICRMRITLHCEM
ncbi:hypothetical protein P692DRAFT_20732109 [Suillus brevipes Sb2]|nr:hypothetical protein P692DRAFT_20732109 [Suillus brevipes Sb2]